jgi:hypothetical protein
VLRAPVIRQQLDPVGRLSERWMLKRSRCVRSRFKAPCRGAPAHARFVKHANMAPLHRRGGHCIGIGALRHGEGLGGQAGSMERRVIDVDAIRAETGHVGVYER